MMEPPSNKKARGAKTTQQQFQLYLHELQENPHFRENKFTAEEPDALKASWEMLTKKLNSNGGPIKDVAGWKKVGSSMNNFSFVDYKKVFSDFF